VELLWPSDTEACFAPRTDYASTSSTTACSASDTTWVLLGCKICNTLMGTTHDAHAAVSQLYGAASSHEQRTAASAWLNAYAASDAAWQARDALAHRWSVPAGARAAADSAGCAGRPGACGRGRVGRRALLRGQPAAEQGPAGLGPPGAGRPRAPGRRHQVPPRSACSLWQTQCRASGSPRRTSPLRDPALDIPLPCSCSA